MDTFGALIDKLATVDMKLWTAQESLYEIRRMTFEEFEARYTKDREQLRLLWGVFKKACDLNIQRNALIDEIDQRLVELVGGKDDGRSIQRKHKTY